MHEDRPMEQVVEPSGRDLKAFHFEHRFFTSFQFAVDFIHNNEISKRNVTMRGEANGVHVFFQV